MGSSRVTSHMTAVLSRSHLGARLACKVSSPAMDAPEVVAAKVDMNLAPSALEMHTPQLLSHHRTSKRRKKKNEAKFELFEVSQGFICWKTIAVKRNSSTNSCIWLLLFHI